MLYTFSKPLTEDQVSRLSEKRRNRKINQYFSNSVFGYAPSPSFKSGLKPDGRLYQIDLELSEVPLYVANLLKYKKHEWSVIVFVGNRNARYLWANKGPDRSQVNVVSFEFILRTARNCGCDVIMAFHNHPASDPHHYSYRRPSSTDLQSAERYSQILNSAKISYLDHVCERGAAYRYCLSPSETLHPLQAIHEDAMTENAQGRLTRIKMHFELYL